MNQEEVAKWMKTRVESEGELSQQDAVFEIADLFGDSFIYINDNGNEAIDRDVLISFRKMTAENVVWLRSEKMWRLRGEWDEESRLQS